jgi:hypothetical protein
MYILGALHDATYSTRHKTYRFSQSSERWLQLLRIIFQKLDRKSWIYKEGKSRSVWVLETSTKLDVERQPVSDNDKIAYVRGYFDTEGGMPKKNDQNLYFQFCQKGKDDLSNVRNWLHELGIKCGVIHNPSVRADSNYWRFFVSRKSHMEFMEKIGSWHPRKRKQIELRMKI